jgi:hypothetical protein
MKKILLIFALVLISGLRASYSQSVSDTTFYLITCGPGTETYSIYGHSALRVTIPAQKIDLTYNWGVFDFSTPNFAFKFARGKLEYLLDADTFDRFIRIYVFEQRWVKLQEINLSPSEKRILMQLITENLKPENLKYLYDFFYDNCSTRIRDLLEKSVGTNLIYATSGIKTKESFRFLTGKYQKQYPWLNFGIDLLLGTPSDKKASYREKMFLPIEMQKELSDAYINRNGRMIPLMKNPETILDYPDPVLKHSFLYQPFFIFSVICIAIILFSALVKKGKAVRIADIVIFAMYTCLSLLMIFTNFITDHQQMKYNFSLLWLNPLIPVCFVAILLKKDWYKWFRVVFLLCVISFAVQIIAPGRFNSSFMPLILIIMVRSSVHAGFSWNPLSLETI